MTKEELEKATGQELIDERNYCGVDGYYGDYLDNVNAEMLKRFNRLAELKEKNKWLEDCKLELADFLGKANEQLTKAKEIIREFMKYEINEYDGSLDIHFEELKKQAEQFISEVEK